MVDEKDDLLRKASELEGKVMELDNIQRNDIEGLEERVESTIKELRGAKEDNAGLLAALNKAELALTEADGKMVEFRDKYHAKKTEVNVLRDKVDKLSAELNRMKLENGRLQDMFESRRYQVNVSEHKSKAYRDIRTIIDDFKNDTIRKY